MKKKKRKLKKKIKIILLILIILVIIIILSTILLKKDNKPITKSKYNYKNTISNILSYNIENNNIDNDFLVWIYNNYNEDVLDKLSKYLKDNDYNDNIWHDLTGNSFNVLIDLYKDNYKEKDNVKIIDKKSDNTSISFVGDVSLADNWYIMPKYDERGKGIYGILSEDVVNIMTSTDIMVANNEFTISDRGTPMPGKYYTFRGSPTRLKIYDEMGVDLVTIANNHVYDFGSDAFSDMLSSLKEHNLPYIGAGNNIEEAMKPYYFIINGYKIAFVNATRAEKNIMTPEATETEGGVFRCYDPTNFSNVIKETKKNSDYVVALIHYGREDSHELEDVQIESSKQYIDSGADIIIGSHAHVLQGMEFYKDKLIVYNLGDFIFNNETKDTGIFTLNIDNKGTMSYKFIPCKEENEYTYLLKDNDKIDVINKMKSWSINIDIDNDGNIKNN